MESCDHHCMLGRYATVLIAIIMALVKTISVITQRQNETNEMDIGEMCYYSPLESYPYLYPIPFGLKTIAIYSYGRGSDIACNFEATSFKSIPLEVHITNVCSSPVSDWPPRKSLKLCILSIPNPASLILATMF